MDGSIERTVQIHAQNFKRQVKQARVVYNRKETVTSDKGAQASNT